MKILIDMYTPMIKASNPMAAGAYLCGWISGIALGLQYAISVCNKSVEVSIDHIEVQLYEKNNNYWFAFKVNRWHEQEAPEVEDERIVWRNQLLTDFYQHTIRPLFESIAHSSGLEVGQLWGQLPTRFYYGMAQWKATENEALINKRIDDDYGFLVNQMDWTLLGRKKSPFDVKIRMVESLLDPLQQVQIKNVCCLYYMTEGGECCYTCPRMKESDRVARRMKRRTEAEANHKQ
ncbi:MAG: Fe-S oxidoreductase [Clostridia bacterium]